MSGLAAAILLVVPAWGQTFDAYQDLSGDNREPAPDIQGEPEDAADTGAVYARLLYLEGGISLRRSAELQTPGSELTANAPLVPGDEIWTGPDGRVEIQMAEGSIVRLSENARLSLMNLADVNGSFDTTNLLRLLNGSLYIHAENFDARQRRFQIDTPAGSVFLLSEGIFRIDVTASGATTVASFRGVAEVLAQESSVIAHSGERLTVAPGRAPGEAMAFNTLRRDAFDLWAEGRDDAIASVRSARGPAPATMPAPVRPYVTELSYYGTWQDTPEYGWVWIPARTDADWRPYFYGHWVWAPIGMVWVSYEPWGYAPYHYGRWQYAPALGWFWAPGYVYAGAYVQWAVGSYYFGWCPLGFYGGPVIYAGFHHDCWTWVGHGHIYDHHVYSHAYSYADVARRHLEQNAYVMRTSPRAYPRYRPEKAGAEIYRATRERRGAVPGRLDPVGHQQRVSFREHDYSSYARRDGSQRAQGQAPAGDRAPSMGRTLPRNNSQGAYRSPGSSSAAPGRTIQPMRGRSQVAPAPGRTAPRTRTEPSVSPYTGRPIGPAVRVTPSKVISGPTSRSPLVRTGYKPTESRVISTPGSSARSRTSPRLAPLPEGRSRSPITRSQVLRGHPHAQVTAPRSGKSGSPFVIVDRNKAPNNGPKSGVKARTAPRRSAPASHGNQGGRSGKSGKSGKKK